MMALGRDGALALDYVSHIQQVAGYAQLAAGLVSPAAFLISVPVGALIAGLAAKQTRSRAKEALKRYDLVRLREPGIPGTKQVHPEVYLPRVAAEQFLGKTFRPNAADFSTITTQQSKVIAAVTHQGDYAATVCGRSGTGCRYVDPFTGKLGAYVGVRGY